MPELDEKAPPSPRYSTTSQPNRAPFDTVSPGVARIEATAEHITLANRVWIFFGVLLIAWAYGLDSTLRVAYQPIAVDALNAHSLLATVTVVRAVIGAAAQPTVAKIADVFGRIEVLLVSVLLYVLGTAIEASANCPATFAVGSLFYQIGYTATILIVEVIVADTTSLRSRLFFSYIPAAPFVVNTWIGGEVLPILRAGKSWRYGFWVWCIAYPISALPLLSSLWWVNRKAKRAGTLQHYKTPVQEHGGWKVVKALFWQLDVIGIILAICVFGFILVPLTINGGPNPTWDEAKFIAPLVIGVLCIPVWIRWESIAPHPMVPFYLLKDRAVWGALAIAFFLMFAWGCQGEFLFSVLRVAFNQSEKSANRIAALYSFCSTLTGIVVGMAVYRVRRLKPFILFGTCLFLVAFGLMIYYRGGVGTHGGIVGAQILLGIAGGFFPYAAQASIQAATSHEHVAVVTGLYLATYNVGTALGNAVAGLTMSQVLNDELRARLSKEAADKWYAKPLDHLKNFPPGTAERNAVIEAFKVFQRVVCIIGASACLGLIVFAFCTRNPRLPDTQSLPYDELPQNELHTSSSGGVTSPPTFVCVLPCPAGVFCKAKCSTMSAANSASSSASTAFSDSSSHSGAFFAKNVLIV
ncbi:siderochrome-iron transporter Sit1 [Macroventuria anomochaeta]|uniref:Siderochrome-iron transporter Sit1 n=1 Tax=Macroventuria anomochaeta TaxID=301207 RepID=A0ACB6S5T1_9PLEO|nr:siderochrome-iron transporter Sit1 [Macroventuria anomochaeta]KAF2628569.1 siderochrome-iron transporter Sit1 [Macroventuria anomochaeta]